jgi:hypothetical protein
MVNRKKSGDGLDSDSAHFYSFVWGTFLGLPKNRLGSVDRILFEVPKGR